MMTRPFELAAVAEVTERAAQGHQPEALEVHLRDGSHALLRPIRSEDKQRLVEGLALLSPRSRYFRFHHDVQHLTGDQLRYLTEVDHRDHVAWVALDPAHADVPGMAVGRYVRLSHTLSVAEAAIAVVDHYQRRGLGTLLLAVLAEAARANGINVFRNYVRADNTEMLELFDQLGSTRQRCAPGVYEVDFPLPDDPDELPDTPAGRAIRAFAREPDLRARLGGALVPVWVERLRRRNDAPEGQRDVTSPWGREDPMLAEWMDVVLQEHDRGSPPGSVDAATAEGT